MGKGKQRRRERKKPTNVPINDFLRCRSPFPIHPPSFAEDLSGPQNSSFITFALSPFSSEGTKRNDRKRERVFLAFYMESCQFSFHPFRACHGHDYINYFTRHALNWISLDHSLFSNSFFSFSSFFLLIIFTRRCAQKTVAGSGNNARFMRASVPFYCMTCVYACVCLWSDDCVYRFS